MKKKLSFNWQIWVVLSLFAILVWAYIKLVSDPIEIPKEERNKSASFVHIPKFMNPPSQPRTFALKKSYAEDRQIIPPDPEEHSDPYDKETLLVNFEGYFTEEIFKHLNSLGDNDLENLYKILNGGYSNVAVERELSLLDFLDEKQLLGVVIDRLVKCSDQGCLAIGLMTKLDISNEFHKAFSNAPEIPYAEVGSYGWSLSYGNNAFLVYGLSPSQ